MNVSEERTKSIWMATKVATAPKLSRNTKCDTVVVGSGIAGLSCAYELASQGQSVVVLDRGAIGSGMTARTTAHLSPICDDAFSAMLKLRGEEVSRLYYESQAAAVDRIEAICKQHAISCNFRRLDGFLFPALGSDPKEAKDELDTEHDAGRKVGAKVEKAAGLPFKELRDVRCLRYPRQATFHPQKYLKGLAAAIVDHGGKLFADTAAVKFEEDDGVAVSTQEGRVVRAARAIVATNSPVNDRVAIHSKQAPYRTYAMAFTLPRGTLKDALYWDTADPYHYVRLHAGPGTTDYVIVGGADHKSGEADDGAARFDALEAWIRGLVPDLGKESHRWSGQVMETVDYSGFIGKNPENENVYIVTGDSGQGMTHGALAGILLRDLIVSGSSPWQEVYDPARKAGSTIGNFVSENLTPVKNFAEYLAPGELNSLDELKPGQGAIVRQGLTKIAAYRDKKGKLHQRSAKCTHMGCLIHWNSTEECWDCPCHGSQFSVDGDVLNGPAVTDLESV